ncbi:FYVE, RhoGEF and PH domain-containing protein 2 [Tachyglossus aculeatus]|uniref:FYVE, RhoGEF and PH domain-containing protein 2 n=1 Tax=Tachyglossus aculeatus TaxID=9261 RepID=UPI0018F3B7D1|nr:FYVE, RhoGEF and PH domain-containing protein 2 [Tachyglossus aculeatus]
MEEEEEGNAWRSVVNLVAVFEDGRATQGDRHQGLGETNKRRPVPVAAPSARSAGPQKPPGARGQPLGPSPPSKCQPGPGLLSSLEPGPGQEAQPAPARRAASMRYLSSFKSNISGSDWRTTQKPGKADGKKQEPEEKKIARELLETEQAYVSRLHLLDQVFFAELLKEARSSKAFPEEVVRLIFSNISSIHQFHSQFFLPELQRRMENWDSNPRIGDVIQKLGPFLKMYSEFVKNFDRALELLAEWTEKCPPFQELIANIQQSEASSQLSLQHHMLEPVQRVPRYELLLKDYIRNLDAHSPDRAHAQKALDVIFSAAQHSNEAIAEMERLQNLWEVYQRLGLENDIVDPSNELLREGPIQKISFRHSHTAERYLFLFNNMLLYCVPKMIQVGAEFQVRTRIDVEGMKVRELNDVEFPNSFLVSGKQRTLELQARSPEEMNSWIQTCLIAISQCEKRNKTFKAAVQGPEGDLQAPQLKCEELGLRAPQWVRDKMVTMCMRCREPFNALTRRRHHCRACGYVVCARCSDFRAELKYDENRPNRVCLECYVFLTGNLLPEEKEERRKGILEKESAKASGQSLICSFLQLLGDKGGKGGLRGWFVIPRDDPLVLYIYAAPQDVKAHTSIPLLGYQVKDGPPTDPRAFRLLQSGQAYTFRAESEELKRRWMSAMAQAASGEGPSEADGDSSDELE